MTRVASKTIEAQNEFTGAIYPAEWAQGQKYGHLNISAQGADWTSLTVTLQRSFDRGENWEDFESYTENTSKVHTDYEIGVAYRIGVKTGDYNTAEVDVRLSK